MRNVSKFIFIKHDFYSNACKIGYSVKINGKTFTNTMDMILVLSLINKKLDDLFSKKLLKVIRDGCHSENNKIEEIMSEVKFTAFFTIFTHAFCKLYCIEYTLTNLLC